MLPLIINIDSALDWTPEVHSIWERFDWEQIRAAIAPAVSSLEWSGRRDALGLIGLVSSLSIDASYRVRWEDNERTNTDDTPDRQWRDRQLGSGDRRRPDGENLPRRKRCFNGEEPHFRGPRVGRPGIVECYGIYVDSASTILQSYRLLEKVPLDRRSVPAIFLCPERIHDVYPTVMGRDEDLRHPLRLSANPALVNLRMTLLHEMGHHFFPVHEAGAGQYLSEGLANYFCHRALGEAHQAWLLYKTRYLQPPEYSAYRPLDVLCEADADCRTAVMRCFHGTLDGWVSLPKQGYPDLDHTLGASLNMALAADGAACTGLWRELRHEVAKENQWLLRWDGGNHIMQHHFWCDDEHDVPADLVLDLYRQHDMTPWLTATDLPKDFWGSWGHGDEVCWPEDCFHALPRNVDSLIARHQAEGSNHAARALRKKLDVLKSDRRVRHYVSKVVDDPASLRKRLSSTTIDDLDWMLTAITTPDTVLGGKWIGSLTEYVKKNRGSYDFDSARTAALLERLPDVQTRSALKQLLRPSDSSLDGQSPPSKSRP